MGGGAVFKGTRQPPARPSRLGVVPQPRSGGQTRTLPGSETVTGSPPSRAPYLISSPAVAGPTSERRANSLPPLPSRAAAALPAPPCAAARPLRSGQPEPVQTGARRVPQVPVHPSQDTRNPSRLPGPEPAGQPTPLWLGLAGPGHGPLHSDPTWPAATPPTPLPAHSGVPPESPLASPLLLRLCLPPARVGPARRP